MTEVRERLRGIGAGLIAKRNEGYSLHVIDQELFKKRHPGSSQSCDEFFLSYHLEKESKPGLGIRAFGTEYHMRLAMTVLFAVPFHKVLLDKAGMDYAKWTTCDYEERQDIRHIFLKTLRETEIKISAVNTQRLSIYFIIVRNLCQAKSMKNFIRQPWSFLSTV